jgi:hypothetical protein
MDAGSQHNPDATGSGGGAGDHDSSAFVFGVPGIRQGLGLTGIKAGGIEITLAPAPVTNPNLSGHNVAGFTQNLPEANGNLASKDFSPWFQNIWPMFLDMPDFVAKEFRDRGYFQREAAYFNYIDPGVNASETNKAENANLIGAAAPFGSSSNFSARSAR